MLHLILAVALHLGGDDPNNTGGAVYCGSGTQANQDSQGNTACVAQASPALAPAAVPSISATPTVVVAEPQYLNTGFGFGRGFGRFRR